jgi:ubiquinone biosynthesis accessory factor UbiJ
MQSLAGNLSEYLVEEERLLITRRALSDFTLDATQLRDRIARLEKRTERLDRRRKRPAG